MTLHAACALVWLVLPCAAQGRAPIQRDLTQLLASRAAREDVDSVLLGLGDDRVPELFTALGELERARATDAGAGLTAAAVRAALLKDHRPALFDHLRSRALLPFVEEERRLGVSLIGEAGAGADVYLLLDVAAGGAPAPTSRALRAEFERSLLRMLARDPRGLQELPQLVARAPAELLEGLIASAGVLNSHAALEALAGALGARPSSDPRILSELGRIGATVDHPVSLFVRQAVGHRLAAEDPLVRVAAMSAVACLGDVDSFPALLEILRREPDLSGFASAALRRLSGKDFKHNAGAWETWYAGQVAWWRDRSGASLDAIASGDVRAAAQALHGLGGQGLFRHDLAKGLTVGLGRDEPPIVLLVCSKLASLRSAAALPELVPLLDNERPEIRAAAQRALCQITGKDLPPNTAAWQAYLAP